MKRTDEAIAAMTAACEKAEHLIPFEEYLTSICTTDEVAEKILDENKSLQGAFDYMKQIAKKRAKNSFAYIPEQEGFQIIREYYGITENELKEKVTERKPDTNIIDITELF